MEIDNETALKVINNICTICGGKWGTDTNYECKCFDNSNKV